MKLLLYLVLMLIFSSLVFAGSIDRSFSSSSVANGGELQVEIKVDVDSSDGYYVIEEHVPEGFEIVDVGEGDNSVENRITWVVITNTQDVTYSYSVKAPDVSGSYEFKGEYGLDNPDVEDIGGDSRIEVGSIDISKVGNSYFIIILIVIVLLIIVVVLIRRRK